MGMCRPTHLPEILHTGHPLSKDHENCSSSGSSQAMIDAFEHLISEANGQKDCEMMSLNQINIFFKNVTNFAIVERDVKDKRKKKKKVHVIKTCCSYVVSKAAAASVDTPTIHRSSLDQNQASHIPNLMFHKS